MTTDLRDSISSLRSRATSRNPRKFKVPLDNMGQTKKVSDYYGELTFDFKTSEDISDAIKKEIIEALDEGRGIKKDHAEAVANAVTSWAVQNGATHFCHWFQPLTGGTAEKHDAFFSFNKEGKAIEKLSASQLMQGEPDASSFPNGGSRSTFEARGYTTWDLTSPMFLIETVNGKTLCIPTAFVSYLGESLDIKTPLLKSISKLGVAATKFLQLAGHQDSKSVIVTCGAEQEYFLIDRAFYYARPDLVMTGRTLFGALTTRNQQLEDHYFGLIPDRVLAFMQEFDYELHRLGIPSKTRHNEVAPGQFEMAPIFTEANVASDNNQMIMTTMRRIAEKHEMMVLLHEKPFAGINGSGKHVNWSMSDNTGLNLLEPGSEPQSNLRFLATIAVIVNALDRNAKPLRMAISGAGNDHRLGANEAPPSIISAYLGDTLDKIFHAIMEDKSFAPTTNNVLNLGTNQLAHLLKDNTDRNRTSPFAFTGNKFEFRAVGSSQAIGFPMTVLNAAVTDVFNEANIYLEAELGKGQTIDQALMGLIKKLMGESLKAVFNGDGYSKEWVTEAAKRGLPNLRTTPEALKTMTNKADYDFLVRTGIFHEAEIETRYNILLERYIKIREIEFETMIDMIHQFVIPSGLEYKSMLAKLIKGEKEFGAASNFEITAYKKVSTKIDEVHALSLSLNKELSGDHSDHQKYAEKIATELMMMVTTMAGICNELEELIPNQFYSLPKYYDMLFLR
jgi:glutamine synthetase